MNVRRLSYVSRPAEEKSFNWPKALSKLAKFPAASADEDGVKINGQTIQLFDFKIGDAQVHVVHSWQAQGRAADAHDAGVWNNG